MMGFRFEGNAIDISTMPEHSPRCVDVYLHANHGRVVETKTRYVNEGDGPYVSIGIQVGELQGERSADDRKRYGTAFWPPAVNMTQFFTVETVEALVGQLTEALEEHRAATEANSNAA